MRLNAHPLHCRYLLGPMALLVTAFLLLAPPSFAGTLGENVTLRGIKAVVVSVEPMDSRAEKDGLTTDLLRTDVELQLRKAGIKVVPISRASPEYLYVRLTVAKSDLRIYGYSVEVQFNQMVQLVRDPQIFTYATTWAAIYAATAPEGGFQRHARDTVSDLLDKFINAYLEQNPKR